MKPKILEIISHVLDIPVAELDERLTYRQINTWDSLAHMNLVLALEQEFKIEFTTREVIEMISIDLILDIMEDKLSTAVV